MKVLVAMNAFKGSLSSSEASSLVAQGFKRGYPEAEVREKPLADGGDGTVDILVRALGGRLETVKVTGPYGDPVKATVGIVDSGRTVVIESASCSGLALAPPKFRDIRIAQSRGVGELMLWAAKRGARKIIVGIGGTAMNDGGIGMAQAAGALVLDSSGTQVPDGLLGLFKVAKVGLGKIPDLFKDVEIVGVSDVNNPLVGPEGATKVYGPQKGLLPSETEKVDKEMAKYAQILGRDLGRDPRDVPMAGAGGGLGGALWAFFGAKLLEGASFILKETGALKDMNDAGLVITGEGKVDSQTKKGKVPFAVARAAAERQVPVIVLGGSLGDDILHDFPQEFSAVFSSTIAPVPLTVAMEKVTETLPFVAEQIGRISRVFALSHPVRREFSAGGIVVRGKASEPEILLIKDRFGYIAPPKGHVNQGETPQEAAIREVKEETGIDAVVEGYIGITRYAFFDDQGRVVEKLVHYYLMTPSTEKVKPQFEEVCDAVWVKKQDLSALKTYPNNREIVEKALQMYGRLNI